MPSGGARSGWPRLPPPRHADPEEDQQEREETRDDPEVRGPLREPRLELRGEVVLVVGVASGAHLDGVAPGVPVRVEMGGAAADLALPLVAEPIIVEVAVRGFLAELAEPLGLALVVEAVAVEVGRE